MSIPWNHLFRKIAERWSCYEIRLHDAGQIDKYREVFPPNMPQNELLTYRWLPARRDPTNNMEMEVARIQFFRIPMGKSGPRPHEITRVLDELDIPKTVQLPEPLEIPKEIKAIKKLPDLEVLAARMRVTLPPSADLSAIHVILAQAANTNEHAKSVLKQMQEAAAAQIGQPETQAA